jgi:uncharacterized MnhB-related membrane protein
MMALQAVALTVVAIAATAVVLVDDPVRQSMVASIMGLFLTSAFFALQAPDVALSMLAVSTVVIPALILLAAARVREIAGPGPRSGDDHDQDEGG